ncbi:unnamed protein product [Cylindrotheca closterium]|uniref:Uncharacterized protein n=1 Tax=Cylindrotheca closterium TaxID=2856 RepID=A0AAD2FUC5_9STRA|nr:unnamed protein product [Cylindrotheca closterium]
MSSENTNNLALVPLHPGSVNKKEPVVKSFPLVLGRTNLANWWWNSCPCEKYCRLHCKPVAQNIRSLSKVMLMVDSKAKMNAVGKNPHLITVIPERTDCVLKQNDIVSIGRRDREPWMRFQVVPATGASNCRQSRRRERRRHGADGLARRVDNGKSSNAPPEWITTTRKRKMSRMSSSSTPPKPPNAPTQQNAANPEHQKRRRKRSRESSFLLSSRPFDETNPNTKADKRLMTGQNKAAYGHLVVQDYKKSAKLLVSDREKRVETSEFVESQGGRLYGGRLPFLSKTNGKNSGRKTPVQGETKLPEAVQPEFVQPDASKGDSQVQRVPYATQPRTPDGKDTGGTPSSNRAAKLVDEHVDQPEDKQPKESEIDEMMNEAQPDSMLVWSADNGEGAKDSLPPKKERNQRNEPSASVKGEAGSSATKLPAEGSTVERSSHPMSLTAKEAESSIMNMPAVQSTFEGTNHHTTPPTQGTRSPNRSVQYSDAELHHWKQIANGEPDKVSAFRRALAGLIVAKNRGKERGDPMWLPDLLEDSSS